MAVPDFMKRVMSCGFGRLLDLSCALVAYATMVPRWMSPSGRPVEHNQGSGTLILPQKEQASASETLRSPATPAEFVPLADARDHEHLGGDQTE
jgi:hypothetical protein